MTHKKKLVLATFVVVLGLVMATPALAVLLTAADWKMSETQGPMIDSSANNNDGNLTDVIQTGSVYKFNGSTSRVVVPDNDSLNPEGEAITLTARVKVTNARMDDDSYDVVRKGLSSTPGGDYKMEIKANRTDPTVGKLHCLFKGTGGRVSRTVRNDIVDGNRHTLKCKKTRNSVVARVDGGKFYTKLGSAGSISNPKEVLVGAKVTDPFDDMFDGSMDSVSIDIAENDPEDRPLATPRLRP